MLFAPPHSPLPRRKRNKELRMTGFLPNIVASEPVHGRKAVAARLYELMTQIKSFPCKSETMVGNAVDTMSYVEERIRESARMRHAVVILTASKALTNRARQIAKKTSQNAVPRSGAGTAVAIVSLPSRFSSSVLVASVAASSALLFSLDIIFLGSNFVEFREVWSGLYRSRRNPSAAGLLTAGRTRIR